MISYHAFISNHIFENSINELSRVGDAPKSTISREFITRNATCECKRQQPKYGPTFDLLSSHCYTVQSKTLQSRNKTDVAKPWQCRLQKFTNCNFHGRRSKFAAECVARVQRQCMRCDVMRLRHETIFSAANYGKNIFVNQLEIIIAFCVRHQCCVFTDRATRDIQNAKCTICASDLLRLRTKMRNKWWDIVLAHFQLI